MVGTVSADLSVTPEEAYRLLEDPGTFQRIVAGARRVRRFDSRWPEAGSRLDHTVGFPPFVIRDQTEVVEECRPERLVLAARVRPFGKLAVEFRIEPRPGGSRLTVREEPVGGAITWPLIRKLTRVTVHLRNHDICRRFRHLTETRRRAAGGGRDA